jgi:hypothetical protein
VRSTVVDPVSLTPPDGIFKNELKAPVKLFMVADTADVNNPIFIIPFTSLIHSAEDGTRNPLGQGLLGPPSA